MLKLIEPTLIQPTFVTPLPKELVPLAKLSSDAPTTIAVFECCINGQEISPGYTGQFSCAEIALISPRAMIILAP
jgi:lysyl-tRNA synthetase class 2